MPYPSIMDMGTEELSQLEPGVVGWRLSTEEILSMVDVTGNYLFLPVPQGDGEYVPPKHVKLKNGRCSNGFINFKNLLNDYPNLRRIFARQIADNMRRVLGDVRSLVDTTKYPGPLIAGIPDAASALGDEVAMLLECPVLPLEKNENKKIIINQDWYDNRSFSSVIQHYGRKLILIEDLCTRGTGVTEAINLIHHILPDLEIVPVIFYIVNRGGMGEVVVDGVGSFRILPLAERLIDEYEPGPETCPFCARGSVPVKAKDPIETWLELKSYEKAAV